MRTPGVGRLSPPPAARARRPLTRVVTAVALVAALLSGGSLLTGSLTPAAASTATSHGADGAAVDRLAVLRALPAEVYERRVLRHVNARRADKGLKPLRLQTCTDRAAERWSRKLAESLEFYHQDLGVFFERCGARYAGETLARGAVWPRETVRMWMESPGHRAVLLSRNPSRVGLGAHLDGRGDWVVAADFVRL